jgi:hypothetical protein
MSDGLPRSIGVFFPDGESFSEILYAASLAKLLGIPLKVFVATDSEAWMSFLAESEAYTNERVIFDRFRHRLDSESGIIIDQAQFIRYDGLFFGAETSALAEGMWLVSNRHALEARRVPIIAPMDETAVFRNEQPGILIPFGNGNASRQTIIHGLAIAGKLHGKASLWHTTWENESLPKETPATEHMDAEAYRVMWLGLAEAERRMIPCEHTIVMAPTVVGGIVDAAIQQDVDLVVITGSIRVARGNHCDAVCMQLAHVVPVLIFPAPPQPKGDES